MSTTPLLTPATLAGLLTPREQKVLRMRFGISENEVHALEAVNHDFEVTRARVRQIEAKTIKRERTKTEPTATAPAVNQTQLDLQF